MVIYSEFSHEKWWFSIVMLNYQRVSLSNYWKSSEYACAEGQSSEAVTAGDPLGSTPSGSDMEAASTASWGVVVQSLHPYNPYTGPQNIGPSFTSEMVYYMSCLCDDVWCDPGSFIWLILGFQLVYLFWHCFI